MKSIDFYFDFISPYTYLAMHRINTMTAIKDVPIQWIPVNLPKLINDAGNVPPASIKNKALYSLRDLKRWASFLDVPFKMIRPGTFDSRPALRIAAALKGDEQLTFIQAVFDALWSGAVHPEEENWLDQVFLLKHLPKAWRDLNHDVIDSNTEAALKAGAFGVPTFILHGAGRSQMFFGVDRIDFLDRACLV
ncbi:MAG: 2-hydroxychromene-2-carboxylate isomerase [Zetaproteobacteria bacterium CG2_30_46_52]|nr:MAG: 2-hydroxychromene-2-carboxylate isomerase [Zetaproteobacteria bacterium CG2_30_46_52]